jgi:hypothetical protein
MRYYYGLLFFLLCTANNAFAQFSDSTSYYLKYATTGILNKTQDSRSYMLTNALAFNVSKKRVSINNSVNWIYGQQDRNLTNNDVLVTSDVNLNRGIHQLYYWGLLTYESSFSLNIIGRGQAGLGVGYTFVDKPAAWFVLTDGFLYETSNLTDPDFGKDVYQTIRNSFRMRYKFLFGKVVTLEGTHFFQPSVEAIRDYIIRSSSTLGFKLRQWISLAAALNYNRINRTRRENLFLSFGITLEKYF